MNNQKKTQYAVTLASELMLCVAEMLKFEQFVHAKFLEYRSANDENAPPEEVLKLMRADKRYIEAAELPLQKIEYSSALIRARLEAFGDFESMDKISLAMSQGDRVAVLRICGELLGGFISDELLESVK